jgi:hypothetical protein
VARDYEGARIEGFFRTRIGATVRGRAEAAITNAATVGETTDLDVTLVADVSALSDGIWDLWLAVPGDEDELRVLTNRQDGGYPVSTFLRDGIRCLRPYDTADRQLSIHARAAHYEAISLTAVDWEGESLLVRARVSQELGLTVRAARVVWCDDESRRHPVELRQEAGGEVILRYDAGRDEPDERRSFEWLVADDAGTEGWVPVGASNDSSRPMHKWLMPARGRLGPAKNGWVAPELRPSGRLVLGPAFPLSVPIVFLRARSFPRAKAEATVKLDNQPPHMPSDQQVALADVEDPSLALVDPKTEAVVPLASLRAVEEQRVSLDFEAAIEGAADANYVVHLAYRINGRSLLQPVPVVSPSARRRYPSFVECARPVLGRSRRWHAIYVDEERNRALRYERRKRTSSEKSVTRAKDALARAAAWAANLVDHRPTWLVGEHMATVAQDNGVVFFEHCIAETKPERVLYVARTSNRHADRLRPNQAHVVRHNSFAHYYYYHRAERLVVAHGIRDVLPSLYIRRVGENDKSVVHLQHGIIALKRVMYGDRTYNGRLDAFVVSSEHEKELMVKFNGMSPERLIVTGLPRYDLLVPGERTRNILVMPTWREWIMASEGVFRESGFLREFRALLTDEKLLAALEAADARIRFYPHIEIENNYRSALDFASERVEICSYAGTDVQREIRDAMALVTDYSSVAWDVNYLRKPVLFFHFDREEYERRRGAYVNLASALPGKTFTETDELRDALVQLLDEGASYTAEDESRSARYYDYRDDRNAERVYRAIRAMRQET